MFFFLKLFSILYFSSSLFSPVFPYVFTSKFSVFSYVFFSMFLLLCFLLNIPHIVVNKNTWFVLPIFTAIPYSNKNHKWI